MLAVLLLNHMSVMSARRRISRREKPVKVDKLARKTAEDVYCRTCLSTEDLVPLFYGKHDDEKRSHDLKLVTGLQIKKNDSLSQKICSPCLEAINKALQFRRTSRKTEKALLNMMSGVKSKKKYSTKLRKSLSKRTKVKKTEPEDMDACHYPYDVYEDSFQDDDYKNVLVKEEKPKIKQKLTPTKKKRMSIPNATSYKCTTCNKEFKMKTTYKAHIRFHTNYCVCESCGKRCRNNNQLQEHKRARHGLGRIHKCAYCEYSSATKEALTIHERRHTGERPYVCDHCGATFHRRSNLVQHIAIHLPEKNFQCDMCPKRLKSRKFLQIHKHNAHTGRRYGYLCPVCAHRFEKPNKCSICNKCEKSKKRLQIHIYKCHRSRRLYRYACPACSESFARAANARMHLACAHHMAGNALSPVHRIQVHMPIMREELRPGPRLELLALVPRGPRLGTLPLFPEDN